MALTTGILQFGTGSHLTSSEEANALATDFVTPGVIGLVGNTGGTAPATGNFAVNAQGTPDTTVAVSSGVAYVTGTPTSQGSQTFRVKNSASANVTISANSSGSTKYDWLYVSLSSTNLANPNTAADNVATLTTSRSSNASTDDGTPPTYGLLFAVVTVANGFSTITNGNISDRRVQATNTTTAAGASNGWQSLGYTPNTVTCSGNRSYSLVFNSVDLTSVVSNGMRLKTTRTVSAPTKCTSLNGSTQYYSKTTPAGFSFTDDFVVSWWVKPSSYALGTIASIYNGTSGWALRMSATGQIQLIGYNAGAANFSQILSNQSIPLNKWTHVAAQLDMSTFTATTTTSYVMLCGVDASAVVSRGGTNPTALVQAGNLNIGAENGGTNPFPGKIANGGFFSAKVTQATIRGYISQSLLGTETSLVSAYSFNNSLNDLNANANNLTAQGSAVATNADSPFTQDDATTPSGSIDFGIITSKVFSTNTTLTVQVPEGCTIPTSGGVSAVSYSTQKIPYGMPTQVGKWRVSSLLRTEQATTSNANYGAFISGGYNLTVPIGSWAAIGQRSGGYKNSTTTSVAFNISSTDLTGLSFTTGADASSLAILTKSSAAALYYIPGVISQPRDLTVATTFVMYTIGATTSAAIDGSTSLTEIFAEFGYL